MTTLTGIIQVYRLVGDRALPLRTIRLENKPRADLLQILAVTRSALPSDCGASLTDERGNNIRPEG